jgi:cytochrome P450
VAARLVEDLVAAEGPSPFVATFAAPLPAEVFAVLFGLPPEDRDRLGRWAASVSRAFSPLLDADTVAEVERAGAELRDYCTGLMERRRRDPADDLITGLLAAEVDGQRLDDDDVVAVMSGFIFAGAETTRRQLTVMVAAFAERPHDWERIAADPGLIPGAVEEVLRHRPIVPGLSRVAVDEYRHDGDAPGREIELHPGERLMVSFLTANRDPQHFERPDEFDLERANAGDHVTFGWGPHFCMGAGLARVELQEALRVLTERLGPPRVEGETVGPGPGFAAPDELTVAFAPRG